jgi:hypothetical protein
LQDQLKKQFNRPLLANTSPSIERQALQEADRTKLEERMQFTRENYRLMRERLMRIVWWKEEYGGKPPANRDVNEAAKNIVMMDLAILQAEAAAGMYKKPVEEIARTIHYEPLPQEVRTVVIAAWERGGLLPARIIKDMIPAEPRALQSD